MIKEKRVELRRQEELKEMEESHMLMGAQISSDIIKERFIFNLNKQEELIMEEVLKRLMGLIK